MTGSSINDILTINCLNNTCTIPSQLTWQQGWDKYHEVPPLDEELNKGQSLFSREELTKRLGNPEFSGLNMCT